MKKTVIYIIVNIVYLVLLYTIPKYFDTPVLWTAIVLVIIYCVSFYLIEHYTNDFVDVNTLEQKIIKIMKDDGYEYKKDESVLCYLMNGIWFRAHFWERWNKTYRTVIVYYGNIDDDWSKISIEGKSVLDAYVNRNYEHIKFSSYEKGVVCEHITSINNAKDFIQEAKYAYRLICEANDAAVDILPQIKQHYTCSEQKNTIGFSTNKKDNHS